MKSLVLLFLISVSAYSHSLVVLQYHHISDRTPRSTSTSPALFKAHLDYLEKVEIRVVDIRQVRTWLNNDAKIPDRTAVITFDDGYRSVFEQAYPELKRRGWPFTVFINSKAHDEKNAHYMSWDQLRLLAENGAVIGNHTDSHPHLIRQQKYENKRQWAQRRQNEIVFAEERIARELGGSYKLFAYPYGEYDSGLREVLAKKGFIAFGQHSGPISKHSDPQALPRFAFGGDYGTVDDFAVKVNSLPFPGARVSVSAADGTPLREPELPFAADRPILRIASPILSYISGIGCYASGQGQISAQVKGRALVARAGKALPAGRSRYNCTANAGGGRYYWHSQLFIRRHDNGEWIKE